MYRENIVYVEFGIILTRGAWQATIKGHKKARHD